MTLNEITPNLSDTYRLAYPNGLDAILGLSHLSDSRTYLPDALEGGSWSISQLRQAGQRSLIKKE